MRANSCILEFWKEEFGIGNLLHKFHHQWACENDEAKQAFLKGQHAVDALFTNVTDLSSRSAYCALKQNFSIVHWPRFFSGGFSCKSVSKQNQKRSVFKECIRNKEGSTGETFDCIFNFGVKSRPPLQILENLKDLDSPSKDAPAKDNTSEADYIVAKYAENDFTAIVVVDAASSHGSVATRGRLWFVVFDIPPSIAEDLQIEPKLRMLFDSMQMDPLPIETFLMDDDEKKRWGNTDDLSYQPSKKAKDGPLKWRDSHEALYALAGTPWPPMFTGMQ